MTDQPLSYWMAVARMGFDDDFDRIFSDLGISRAELAERFGATPAYISKLLNGRAGNYQLETMVKLARAIEAIVQIRLIKGDGEVVRVLDYETARALDEKQHAATASVATSVESLASISYIQDYLPSNEGSVKKTSFAQETALLAARNG